MNRDASQFLGSVGIFARIDPAELEPLASRLRPRAYQKGEVIFHQDDPGDRLHFVAEGMVKISIVSTDGRENDIALLSRGDCFGEMSVLDGGRRSATAVAVEPTQTMTSSREDFISFLNEHVQVAIDIISLMARRLRNMDEMIGDMVFLDVPTRVAKKLTDLAETYAASRDDSGKVTIPLGQEEMSRLVGSSREAVSRALATYRRMGLLTTSHRRITIDDLQGLERMAAG
jgi:CRP/FNR family transcriptional regulator/CRP/FNR family cyclic AMP-dependent transcriptional regulator